MIQFAEGLIPTHLIAALRTAEPLTEVSRYRYPASQRRRYDKMRRFPPACWLLATRFAVSIRSMAKE